MRKTIDRQHVVDTANNMIAHLGESGTMIDCAKREAIIALTESILIGGNSYKGFQYTDKPQYTQGGMHPVWDGTRIRFN